MTDSDSQTVVSSPATVGQVISTPPPSTASPWPVFWVASMPVFLVSMDGTMLFTAFSALRTGLAQATAADLSWVLNAYTVVYAAMLIPSGGLADRHGRKRVFLVGISLFLAASVACGLAVSVERQLNCAYLTDTGWHVNVRFGRQAVPPSHQHR